MSQRNDESLSYLPGVELPIRDPVLFYPLDSGSGMNFFPDPEGVYFGEIYLIILVLLFFTNKT
jgi:hypothetical protein